MHRLPDGRTLMQASLDSISAVCDEVLIAVRHEDISVDAHAATRTEHSAHGVSEVLQPLLQKLSLQATHTLHRVSDNNTGMGDSLATLAKALLERNSLRQDATHAVLVALADMPFIEASTLQALTREAQRVFSVSEEPMALAAVSNESTNKNGPSATTAATQPSATDATIQPPAKHPVAPALIIAPRHAGVRGHPVLFSAMLLKELTLCSGDTGARPVLEVFKHRLLLLDVHDAGVVRDIDTP